MRLPAELLLPLSYAVSRPVLAGLLTEGGTMPLAGAMPAAFACAVLSRYVDRVLHGLLPPSHVKGARPDALVLVLSVLM